MLREWTEAAIRDHLTDEMIEANAAIEREWRGEAEGVVREIRERCGDIMERYGVE